ncbi:MAG TPA: hypothetical protein VGQ76_12155 [Thermoanaerobaculia bacterium]|jgi:hypothetical protein|nr:hypothetical protein [Thermoanaerobaculia bacterium]
MRKLALALVVLLQISALPLFAAEECTLCVGLATSEPAASGFTLARVGIADLATFAPAEPRNVSLVVEYVAADLAEVEAHTKTIIDWAKTHGPLDSLGVNVTSSDPSLVAFAIKRLSTSAQGQGVATRILLPHSENLVALFESGTNAYFDVLVVDAARVTESAAWLAEKDPSKKIYAVVGITSPNALFDLGQALASGATRAYASGTANAQALAQFNRSMTGDWAYDATSKIPVLDPKGASIEMPVLMFVRGEDLRTVLIARGDAAAATILSLPADRYTKPRRIDAAGERDNTDTGRRGANLLVGSPAVKEPYAVVVDYVEKTDRSVTKETLNIATERGITVEEIIRNHQSYDAFQESIEPRWMARNTTSLRFDIGGGAEALEAAIAGDYFSAPDGKADWVWSDFFINGVKWKYGKIPELPLIQPEKVAQLPLDLHLSNDYRYELVRTTDLLGYKVYEVRFVPPPNAPAELPLYRGTVWIDAKSWARIRINMVQLNLTGEILSNEERVDFVPFSRESRAPITAAEVGASDARNVIWLPAGVVAQQVISAAGRASVVQRTTTFENFRLDPPEFDTLLAQVSASDARMVRETDAGMRYLEKRDGQRVVKEGFDTSQIFALGGVHHDKGLEYPVVPLGGIDYFNFNLFNKGIQTNVFFAGVVLAANATHPNVGGTRTNIGFDFFGIAVPTENTMFRGGIERPEEGIKSRPMGLFARIGHPFAQFGKIDVSFGVSHQTYSAGEDTPDTFGIPSSTFTFTPGIELRYARRGWSFSASYDYNTRSEWEPWGNLAEYDPEQKTFAHYGASLGKSFYLPKFQRIGVDFNYIDGTRLDRFSKYELGFFGSQRVHGVQSGSVHAERAIIGHLSYGFVISQQFRLEAFYDHALIDDALSGYEREPFQGLGIAGQTVGPYGTLLRLDIGKMIGRNAQEGFVANVVFLKLF